MPTEALLAIFVLGSFFEGWADLATLDLTAEGKGSFNLGQKKGIEFRPEDFGGFCEELYAYIKQYKREIDLFEATEARLDKIKLDIKTSVVNFFESPAFKETLRAHDAEFENIFQQLSANQISPQEYYVKIGQILSQRAED